MTKETHDGLSEILEAACHEKLCSRKLQEANGDGIKWERKTYLIREGHRARG